MEIIILILVLYLFIDTYYFFRTQRSFNLITAHLSLMNTIYEKELLKNKIISRNQLISVRENLKEVQGDSKIFKKARQLIVSDTHLYDQIMFQYLQNSSGDRKQVILFRDSLIDALYYLDKNKILNIINEIEKDNIKNSNKKPDDYIKEYYGDIL